MIELHCLSIVDACANWPEFAMLANHTAQCAATTRVKTWLCHDNGAEFIGYEFQEMLSYTIKS